ncbi:MAG: AI-2E family transporter [Proteobacteria bacterium]|nr:AI-2E family transporter [Pseudomonadota bacterium]MBU1738225.1 AI-2E family transporter [Pseudomonadota bacterium]
MVLKYFLLLFLLSMLLVARLLWPFISILILSFILAGIFQPVYQFINKKFSDSFSSMVTCLLVILIVFIPLLFFVVALSKEALDLYHLSKGTNISLKIKELIFESSLMLRIQDILTGYGIILEPDKVGKTLSEFSGRTGLFLFNQAKSWAANAMLVVFNFFIMIITIFFLLKDHEKLITYLLSLSPLPDNQERQLIQKFKKIAGAVLIGNGICGLIQGALGALAFVVFNLGAPILWGGIMLILAFLPIFGIGLVLIPAAFLLMLQGHLEQGLAMLLFYATLSFSVEYILKPQLVGKRVKMHTLLVFLSILGGLKLFGFLGIIYGPLIITTFMTMAEIYLANYNWYVTHDGGQQPG